MKHLIFFIFLLSSSIAYGQNPDLIVTTGGDSLKCKIVEVNASEIQFRFDTGSIISIPRNEVASHQYNYIPANPTNRETPAGAPKEKKKTAAANPPFYVALTAGASTFGSYSMGKIEKGGPGVFGADVAYFFLPYLGAGLKVNVGICEVDFGESLTYNETITFAGPALHGIFRKGVLAFTGVAGVGVLNWNYRKKLVSASLTESYTTAGASLSAGVNYMLTRHVGVVFNVQSVLGAVKDDAGNERKPAGIGASLGLNVRL